MSHSARSPEPKATRPRIPGYGIPETEEGMLPWTWVDEQMSKAKHYWVSTTRPDGRPHVVPVWGLWFENRLYFGGGEATRHMRNLAVNSNVVVHLESGSEVVIVEGIAHPLLNPDAGLLAHLKEISIAKYGVGGGTEGIWVITPQVAFAWREYPSTATRFRFNPQ